MLNATETARSSTTVPLSPVLCTLDEQDTVSLDPDNLVMLRVGTITIGIVSPTLNDGYLAACKAYAEMEQTEYGAYFFLTGYEYAHLTRQYLPIGLSPVEMREWQRGFIVGWNACTFGLETGS